MSALETAGKFFTSLMWWRGVTTPVYAGATTDDQYPDRPEMRLDQKDMVGKMEFRVILNSARHVYNAYPMVKGAIDDIANHTVGNAWNPQSQSRDIVFARVAENWMRQHSKIVDIRGNPYDLNLDMRVAVITLCRDGEFFINFTSNEAGYPLIQFVEAHRIGNRNFPDGPITQGLYTGLQCRNGVAYDRVSRPIAYHYLADNIADDQWVPAGRMYHAYDPQWFSQGRGVSPLIYGMLDWLDVHGWRDNEKMAQLMFSSVALIESNETGAPNPLDPSMRLKKTGAGTVADPEKKSFFETFRAGQTRYLKFNGANLKALENGRPGPNQANFEERVLRGAFRALGWTYEQAIDSSKQGGANVRRDVAQNQNSVTHFQGLVGRPWERIVVYSIAAANALQLMIDTENGQPVELPVDWYKWIPQLPQKMTVDYGRDRRVDIEELRVGSRTMIRDIRDHGGDEEQHAREQVAWWKLKQRIADEEGIPAEKMAEVFGSLAIPGQVQSAATEDGEDKETDEKAKENAA